MAQDKTRYVSMDSFMKKISGKITINDSEKDSLNQNDLQEFVLDAEAQIEEDLNKFYLIPFQETDGGDFDTIYEPTQRYIRRLILWNAVETVLEDELGRKNLSRGGDYIDNVKGRYNKEIERIMALRSNGMPERPPLKGLALNAASLVYNTTFPTPRVVELGQCSGSRGEYAKRHSIDPRRSWQFYTGYGPGGYGPGRWN